MGLFKLVNKNNSERYLESASKGRAIKEISELDLTSEFSDVEKKILKELYNLLLEIDTQENKFKIVNYLNKLILDIPLTSIENPLITLEYVKHSEHRYQSSRCKSLFSHDAGDSWYDIDNDTLKNKIFRWIYKNIFKRSSNTPTFITSRMMPYVKFPYTKDIK